MRRIFEFGGRYGRWALIAAYAALSAVVLRLRIRPIRTRRLRRPGPSSAADLLAAAVTIAAGTGVLAASLVEVVKRLTGVRGRYHEYELREYLRETAERQARPVAGPAGAPPGEEGRRGDPWRQLESALGNVWPTEEELAEERRRLSRGGRFVAHPRRDPRYFFDLPLEQLMGQIAAALQVALATPQRYVELLRCFAGTALPPDERDEDELEMLLRPTPPTGDELVAAQAVVHERMQRSIDGVQVIVGHRWRWFVRGSATGVCGILGILAVKAAGTRGSARVLVWLLCAGPGSAFAWLARDAAAVVERWRR
ncbi:hypothetical protein ACI780_01550 [Geodermatophilus sp. SYSU D00814]